MKCLQISPIGASWNFTASGRVIVAAIACRHAKACLDKQMDVSNVGRCDLVKLQCGGALMLDGLLMLNGLQVHRGCSCVHRLRDR